VVIHVLAEASSVDAPPDPHLSGRMPSRPMTRNTTLADALAPDPEPPTPTVLRPAGVIAGGGPVPAALLAELVHMGVPVRPLRAADTLTAEPGYRPSVALQRFVRCRDLTCRFPGCDQPLIWKLSARDASGKLLDTNRENGVDVFRRQPDGSWKIHVSHAFTQE
jgi:hypothetical protein